MRNYIFEKIKEVLIKEEVNNKLIDKGFTEILFANHSRDLYSIETIPQWVGYIYTSNNSLYDLIASNENCGEDVISLLKLSNGELKLATLLFKDFTINVVSNYPSKSYGVDVSISFEVAYQGSFVETLTPSIIPGAAADLKDYLLLLVFLLQDEVDSVNLVDDRFFVPLSIEEFKASPFYIKTRQTYLGEKHEVEVFYFNQDRVFKEFGLRLYIYNTPAGVKELRLMCGDYRSGYFKEFVKVLLEPTVSEEEVLSKTLEILENIKRNDSFYKKEQLIILKNYTQSYFETVR